jgi:hypothetical protein
MLPRPYFALGRASVALYSTGLFTNMDVKLKLCVCVRAFAYNSRTDVPICAKLCMLIHEIGEILQRPLLRTVSRFRIPVTVVPVARKLITMEEWR